MSIVETTEICGHCGSADAMYESNSRVPEVRVFCPQCGRSVVDRPDSMGGMEVTGGHGAYRLAYAKGMGSIGSFTEEHGAEAFRHYVEGARDQLKEAFYTVFREGAWQRVYLVGSAT
jgi:hypothetical protein